MSVKPVKPFLVLASRYKGVLLMECKLAIFLSKHSEDKGGEAELKLNLHSTKAMLHTNENVWPVCQAINISGGARANTRALLQ